MTMNSRMYNLRSFDEIKLDQLLKILRDSVYGEMKFGRIRRSLALNPADSNLIKNLDYMYQA